MMRCCGRKVEAIASLRGAVGSGSGDGCLTGAASGEIGRGIGGHEKSWIFLGVLL